MRCVLLHTTLQATVNDIALPSIEPLLLVSGQEVRPVGQNGGNITGYSKQHAVYTRLLESGRQPWEAQHVPQTPWRTHHTD